MDPRKIDTVLPSQALSHASVGSSISPLCASTKGKIIQIEGPHTSVAIDDVKVDMALVENFDASNYEDVRELQFERTTKAHALDIQPSKRRKTSAVWECFSEELCVGDTKYAVCKYCKKRLKMQKTRTTTHLARHISQCVERKKALGKKILQGGQLVLGFKPLKSRIPDSLSNPPILKMNSKYDHKKVREAMAHMILMDELSFKMVEHVGFNFFCRSLQPMYEKIGKKQAKVDCQRVVDIEIVSLKKIFANVPRISVTIDLWKSDAQNIEYMVITAHWVDQTWSLNKRIINFVHLPPPRRGVDIAKAMFSCFKDWGIENKVHTITIGNTSTNDICVSKLKANFDMPRRLLCDGKFFHVRCITHIVNLLVQDGLTEIKSIIEKIRESVKYIKASEARQLAFFEIAQHYGIKERKLVLDCPTRWNSTYNMLSTLLRFREVFPMYGCVDESYMIYCPLREEWNRVAVVCEFLEIFNDITKIVAKLEYPTSNFYFIEVIRIKGILSVRQFDPDPCLASMVSKMATKFDKYWQDVNVLMAIAGIMDPRIKFSLIEIFFPNLFGEYKAKEEIQNVRKTLESLYGEYVDILSSENPSITQSQTQSPASSQTCSSRTSPGKSVASKSWQRLWEFKRKMESKLAKKSELEMYLEDSCVEIAEDSYATDFSALQWWQDNQSKYKVLSRMAAEILAIPFSTVASKCAFNVGSRVIDPYRASLAPKTVNMLICGGDWVQAMHWVKKPVKIDNEAEVTLPLK